MFRIPKKLKVWKRKLEQMDYCLNGLKNHGFRWQDYPGVRVWFNDKEGIVIKASLIVRTSSIPATAAPTIIVRINRDSDPILIQVICKIPESEDERWDIATKLMKRNRNRNTDIHDGNVGFYRGHPVLFDW